MLVNQKKKTFYFDYGQKKKIKAFVKKKFHTNLFKQILMGMSE